MKQLNNSYLRAFIFNRKLDLIHFKFRWIMRWNNFKYWLKNNFLSYEWQNIKENMTFKNVTLFVIGTIVWGISVLYAMTILTWIMSKL